MIKNNSLKTLKVIIKINLQIKKIDNQTKKLVPQRKEQNNQQ